MTARHLTGMHAPHGSFQVHIPLASGVVELVATHIYMLPMIDPSILSWNHMLAMSDRFAEIPPRTAYVGAVLAGTAVQVRSPWERQNGEA